jgi:hypothetical protein
LKPLYIYDARSTDDTQDILREEGCELASFHGTGADIAEAGNVEFGAGLCGEPWALRMDDDEFPSERLFAFLRDLSEQTEADAYFVPTRELFRVGDAVYYSRLRYRYFCHAYGSYLNPHLRLFKPRKVRVSHALHSPGLEVQGRVAFAPRDAYHAHFNSVIRTVAQRLEKVRKYDAIQSGMGWFYGDEYLPEFLPFASHRARGDEIEQFKPLLDAFPKADASTRPTLSDSDAAAFSDALARKWRMYFEDRGCDDSRMDRCAGAEIVRNGKVLGAAPPATHVFSPRRRRVALEALCDPFGELDAMPRRFGALLRAAASPHTEIVLLSGASPRTDEGLTRLLRHVARTPLEREVEACLMAAGPSWLVRVSPRAPLLLKIALILASFAAVRWPRLWRASPSYPLVDLTPSR